MDGRAQRRTAMMKQVQMKAIELFEARGFAAVTVEEVAQAAGVGPATVYRIFGTKERLVFWDEYDPLIFSALSGRLPRAPLARTVLDAIVASLDQIYAEDAARILRRTRLIASTPALTAAASAELAALRRALAKLFLETRSCLTPLESDVAAGAVVSCLSAAVDAWSSSGGRVPLRQVINDAFRALERATCAATQER